MSFPSKGSKVVCWNYIFGLGWWLTKGCYIFNWSSSKFEIIGGGIWWSYVFLSISVGLLFLLIISRKGFLHIQNVYITLCIKNLSWVLWTLELNKQLEVFTWKTSSCRISSKLKSIYKLFCIALLFWVFDFSVFFYLFTCNFMPLNYSSQGVIIVWHYF